MQTGSAAAFSQISRNVTNLDAPRPPRGTCWLRCLLYLQGELHVLQQPEGQGSCAPVAGRFDVPIPPLHPPKQSDHVASILYIADFLTQFSKVLAIKPVAFQELCACLHPGASPNALLASNPPFMAAGRSSAAAAAKHPMGGPGRGQATAVAGAGKSHATAVGVNAGGAGLSNGVLQQGQPVGNGTAPNGGGGAASGGCGEKEAEANVALFDLYRGLLQFLLQVSLSYDHHAQLLCPVSFLLTNRISNQWRHTMYCT